jgi:hypothetical protein
VAYPPEGKSVTSNEAQMRRNVDAARSVEVFGRKVPMPRSRLLRILLGILLIFGGLLGFLPILGLWMLPFGLLVLSYEFAMVRRWRRRSTVWWERRRRAKTRARGD